MRLMTPLPPVCVDLMGATSIARSRPSAAARVSVTAAVSVELLFLDPAGGFLMLEHHFSRRYRRCNIGAVPGVLQQPRPWEYCLPMPWLLLLGVDAQDEDAQEVEIKIKI